MSLTRSSERSYERLSIIDCLQYINNEWTLDQ